MLLAEAKAAPVKKESTVVKNNASAKAASLKNEEVKEMKSVDEETDQGAAGPKDKHAFLQEEEEPDEFVEDQKQLSRDERENNAADKAQEKKRPDDDDEVEGPSTANNGEAENNNAGAVTHEIGEEEMLDIAEQIFNMIAQCLM